MLKHFVFAILGILFLTSCGQNQDAKDKAETEDPYALAASAAGAYQSGIQKTHRLIQNAQVTSNELDKIFDGLKREMTAYGQKAENFKPDDKGIYQHKFQLDAYDGLDSIAYVITSFKDSLKEIDPNDTRVVQIEGIMSLSVYADFDQLRRVYPSKYATLTKAQN